MLFINNNHKCGYILDTLINEPCYMMMLSDPLSHFYQFFRYQLFHSLYKFFFI